MKYAPVFALSASLFAGSANSWHGEWGEFARTGGAPAYRGERLSLMQCDQALCRAELSVLKSTGHGDGKGTFTLLDDGTGQVVIGTQPHVCKLHLKMTGPAPNRSIDVQDESGDCGYFSTASSMFEGHYPFRSAEAFVGRANPMECFIGDSAARMRLCLDPAVASRHDQWQSLVWQVSDEVGLPREYGNDQQRKMLTQCDAASDPAVCLKIAYAKDMESLLAKHQIWLSQITQPGDPEIAAKLIAAIKGSYQHSFPSGTVDGSTYIATDKLTITAASKSAIRFDVHLDFYNGHECSLGGAAEFKQNGHFVLTQTFDSNKDTCRLELVPGKTSVELRDPTGACRAQSCGMRGGYNGASFPLSERR